MKRERQDVKHTLSTVNILSCLSTWCEYRKSQNICLLIWKFCFSLWVAVAAGWEGQSRLNDRFQLFLQDPQTFPSQLWNVISLVGSGSALGSLPSDAARLGAVLVRCPNHVNRLLLIGGAVALPCPGLSSSSRCHGVWDQQPCRGTSFPLPVLVTLFLWTLSTSCEHKWG